MSRWDRLKTDVVKQNSKANDRWSTQRRPTQSIKSQSALNVRSYEEILAAFRNTTQPTDFQSLVDELSGMDLEHLRTIPAEQAAIDLIDAFLVETLKQTDISLKLERSIMIGILTLLRVPSICCAVLAPLTIDVAPTTGVEKRIPNPVGERLVLALQLRMPRSCSTLIRIVDEMRKRSIADTLPLDLVRLEQFFTENLLVSTLHAQYLELLRLILVTFPDSYMPLKWLFLSDFLKKKSAVSCTTCQYIQDTSPLTTLLHDRACTNQLTTCIATFLKSFPLDAWLDAKNAGSMKLFGENVKGDLVQLIRAMKCRFSPSDHFCKLVTVVLMTIPYPANGNDVLTREAINLTSCAAQVLMDGRSHTHVVECLCECMGGRPLPHGGNTLMSIPVKRWLFSSCTFQKYIFTSVAGAERSSRLPAITLLCSIVRTQPGFASWQQFQTIVQNLISTAQYRTEGMLLLEAFAVGRSMNAEPALNLLDAVVSLFLITTLNAVTLGCSSRCRLSCLHAYCAFLPVDWSFAVESNNIGLCIDQMVRFSIHGTSNEKPLALKAIGEMLSKCSSGAEVEDSQFAHLSLNVLPILQGELAESTPPAKLAMAIFAIGNLALGIRERNAPQNFVAPFQLLHLLKRVGTFMDASNDKVSGNAIRTVGHVAHLAFHEPYLSGLSAPQVDESFQSTVEKLSEKLRQGMGGRDSSGLTWKQRSSAKKHGWGCCHSLGLALACDVAINNLDESRAGCRALQACLEQNAAVTEKTVMASIAAFLRLETYHLEAFSRGTGLVGMVVSCCLTLISDRSASSRIRTEVERLLLHTVPILSVFDVCLILRAEATNSSHLEWLYDWMLSNDMNAEPYEKFAIAFDHTNDWDSNIGLEQRFASRAAWGYREESADAEDEDEI
jgi:hypothetical protein